MNGYTIVTIHGSLHLVKWVENVPFVHVRRCPLSDPFCGAGPT